MEQTPHLLISNHYINQNPMAGLNPYAAIASLIIIAAIPVSILYKDDLLTTQQYPAPHCIESSSSGYALCGTCVARNQIKITKHSNMIFSDTTEFQVVRIPKSGVLMCQQIMQLINFEHSIATLKSNIFQSDITVIKEIVRVMEIDFGTYKVSSAQIQPHYEQTVLLQLKKKDQLSSSMVLSYSTFSSKSIVESYVQALSACTLICSILYVAMVLSQEGELKASMVGSICISTMILAQSAFKNGAYLIEYSICLFVAICLTKSKPHRIIVLLTMVATYLLSSTIYQPICYMVTIIFFKAYYVSEKPTKENTFITLSLILICCLNFVEIGWQSLFPSPVCQIYEMTLLCMVPIMVQIMAPPSKKITYEKVPQRSGVSLPGFEDSGRGDDVD